MSHQNYTRDDFAHSPYVVFYEVTQACDLACKHCRACAQPLRDPQELDGELARRLIDQLASFPKPPLLVFTGGDPLKRGDIHDLVAHAGRAGLEVAMTPSATPLVTAEALRKLRDAGLHRLAVSLDGVDAATHDAFRGVSGSYQRTLEIISDAQALGLPMQINTTITRRSVHQIDALAELLASFNRDDAPAGQSQIVLWSVFFLIPVGRGTSEERISPEQYEQVFERLWHHARCQPYGIKTTEAHHYRRFVLQRKGNPQRSAADGPGAPMQRAPLGVNDGKGVMFISHTGRVYPSGFLPIECGRFPLDSVVDVYQNAAAFRQLRNAELLKGKCGICEYRHICGGSRARAFAVSGDPLGEEPDCVYEPKRGQAGGRGLAGALRTE